MKNAQCQVACNYLGYDSGMYISVRDVCACLDEKDFNATVNRKRLVLPRRGSSSQAKGNLKSVPEWKYDNYEY